MRKIKNAKHKFLMKNDWRKFKKKKQPENNKEKEKVMWEELDSLNKKFKGIKKHERAGEKKISATIV